MMSRLPNEIRRNGSGVPGLRLNTRRGYKVIDVSWYAKNGRRRATSYLAHKHPVVAVRRAMQRREAEIGVRYKMTAREAWVLLSRAAS